MIFNFSVLDGKCFFLGKFSQKKTKLSDQDETCCLELRYAELDGAVHLSYFGLKLLLFGQI